MSDPQSRKNSQLSRLRQQLRKKREALADQFDFKIYTVFHFKEHNGKKKPCAVFEMAEVVPIMTNNYEDDILKGVKEDAYTYESTKELLDKDVVQLHAPRWQSLRKDVIGCTSEMDFFLWPRNDIARIECHLFSRWKEDNEKPFMQLQEPFEFSNTDYERQLMRLLTKKEKTGLIINNPEQSVFLFVDRQQLQTATRKPIVFKLNSMCLYLPQDRLMHWGPESSDEILQQLFEKTEASV